MKSGVSETSEIPIVTEKELLVKLSHFLSGNLSFVIPLFSHFHFTLNKYEEVYLPKQNKGAE